MEKNNFESLLKEKLLEASKEKANPDWKRMRLMLKQQGLTRPFTIPRNVLLTVLSFITLVNAGILWYLLTGKVASDQYHAPLSDVKKTVKIVDTVYRYDTVVSKKTVYLIDTVYVYQKAPLRAEWADDNGRFFATERSHAASDSNVGEQTGGSATDPTPTRVRMHASSDSATVETNQTTTLLNQSREESERLMRRLNREKYNRNKDSLNQKTFYGEQSDIREPLKEKKNIKKERKQISASFFAGGLLNPLWVTDKDFQKWKSFQYGITASALLNQKYEIQSGFLFCISSYELNQNGLSQHLSDYPVVTDQDSISELKATSKYYSIPINFRYRIPIADHVHLVPELGIEYYMYTKQTFDYEYYENKVEQEKSVVINNSYSGFGHLTTGLGITYTPYRKLHLIALPKYYFPMAALGAEKISHSMISTEFQLMWQF